MVTVTVGVRWVRQNDRPKFSDPAHEGVGSQPGRDGRVRCHVGLKHAPIREHAQAELSQFIQPNPIL